MPATPDFRAAAVAASMLRLGGRPEAAPRAGISCCVPASPDSPQIRRRLQAVVLSLFVGGFALAGLGLVALIGTSLRHGGHLGYYVGGGLVVVGVMAIHGVTVFGRILSQRAIAARLGATWGDHQPTPQMVELEDAASYNQLKIVSEDVAALIARPESRCVQLEGISCCYIIYGADVVSLVQKRAMMPEIVQIEYMIGNVQLSLLVKAVFGRPAGLAAPTRPDGGLLSLLRNTLALDDAATENARQEHEPESIQQTDEDEAQPPSHPPATNA